MVDRTGLENRRAARSRGFESLSLRQAQPLFPALKANTALHSLLEMTKDIGKKIVASFD